MLAVDRTVRLVDGRVLSFAEYGEDGVPVMLFHGAPGDRRMWGQLPGFPFHDGVRLIAPDRPGYGRSDFNRNGTYVDWAQDVETLADALGIDSFFVVGVSGGGPPALACAWKMPERIRAVAVVSTTGPPVPEVLEALSTTNRQAYRVARWAPWLMRANMKLLAWMQRRNLDRYLETMSHKLPDVDRAALRRPDIHRALTIAMSPEAVTRQAAGYGQDVINQARAWPFDPAEISIPVRVWQPEDDTSTPPAVGRLLERTIPDCVVFEVPDAGHLWQLGHIAEVLDDLVTCGQEHAGGS